MVNDKLDIVLPRLLQPQCEDKELVQPVRGVHEIIRFQSGRHLPLRIICFESILHADTWY